MQPVMHKRILEKNLVNIELRNKHIEKLNTFQYAHVNYTMKIINPSK